MIKAYKTGRDLGKGRRNTFTVHLQVLQKTGALSELSLLFLLAGSYGETKDLHETFNKPS